MNGAHSLQNIRLFLIEGAYLIPKADGRECEDNRLRGHDPSREQVAHGAGGRGGLVDYGDGDAQRCPDTVIPPWRLQLCIRPLRTFGWGIGGPIKKTKLLRRR